jgi:hypothetical protein
LVGSKASHTCSKKKISAMRHDVLWPPPPPHYIGAAYTSDFVCDFMCDFVRDLLADAILCPTRNCYRLHVPCDFAWQFAVRLHGCTQRQRQNRHRSQTKSHLQLGGGVDSGRTTNSRYTKSHLRLACKSHTKSLV